MSDDAAPHQPTSAAIPRDPFDDVQPIGVRPTGASTRAPVASVSCSINATTRTRQSDAAPVEERDDPREQPVALRTLSEYERQRRGDRTRRERTGRGDVHHDGKEKRRRFSRAPLKVLELLAMTSELARKFHSDAIAPLSGRAADAKHAGIGYAVMVDKLNVLSGRPTEILAIDDVRPASHELADKLALVQSRRTA